MKVLLERWYVLLALFLATSPALGQDWMRFRGPNASAVSAEKGLPVHWSDSQNIVWRTKLPGPGSSSPIEVGDRVYVTCYSGYGVEEGEGKVTDLVRHVVCVDRKSGNILWDKQFPAAQPEEAYRGFELQHGYASSTPASDGQHLYVFFGKSGVFCLDLDGQTVWHKKVGERTHNWGSATSPVIYKDLVFINASVESGSLVALNKKTGTEVWRAKDISSSWNTPVLVDAPNGRTELVLAASNKMQAFDPEMGKLLWYAKVYNWYIDPSIVAHAGVLYGLQHTICVAVKAGGEGDVTKTHVLWKKNIGHVVSSPVVHDGYLYFTNNGTNYCVRTEDGKEVYKKSLTPRAGTIYASPIIGDGKIYFVSQRNGTYVVAEGPEFKQLAHNVFKDDNSRTNASPIVSRGCLLLRTDLYLYCIGKKS